LIAEGRQKGRKTVDIPPVETCLRLDTGLVDRVPVVDDVVDDGTASDDQVLDGRLEASLLSFEGRVGVDGGVRRAVEIGGCAEKRNARVVDEASFVRTERRERVSLF
jgi:hypothetical protein